LGATEHHTFDGIEDGPAFQHKVLGNIPADVRLRMVLVEDLSEKIISLLGGALHMSPEFLKSTSSTLGGQRQSTVTSKLTLGTLEALSRIIPPSVDTDPFGR